ncbi:hypothetical protein PHLGIDRAFT_123868 [Phlebiopsis gigantea 11061_1 CR5-6]|uniref:Ribosome maturation protein SDO1/SBDS N-terminal domain-containing protein n=1 Tax=Phlebiopsis gigantea (strain 11061_1 CR5-6) TaxID=745531 RepID=A0A0C3PXG6_PHLG1|nr:hypothetical protein PHLGIDRAFT_123868 [Phlebiopsis gigantea 11061_1 CR5-6]
MVKALTKVVYKPSTQSTDEFTIIVNHEEFKRWKDGGDTIPLVEVVDSFTVFFSNQGTQGILGQASKQQLENVFGTTRDDEVVRQVLEKGALQAGEGIKGNFGSTNVTMGSLSVDSRGKGTRGI